jgi:hypothetical protein
LFKATARIELTVAAEACRQPEADADAERVSNQRLGGRVGLETPDLDSGPKRDPVFGALFARPAGRPGARRQIQPRRQSGPKQVGRG